jgi:hypothetical protein
MNVVGVRWFDYYGLLPYFAIALGVMAGVILTTWSLL